MFGMINNGQLIVSITMFDVQMPANAEAYFSFLNQIVSFDFFDVDPIINKLLKLESTEPFNEHFRALGYSSMYFLNNMGLQLVAFFSFILFIILHQLLIPFAGWYRIAKLYEKGRKSLFYSSLFTLLMESYGNVAICCMIAFYRVGFQSKGQGTEVVSSFIFFGIVVLFYPAWILFHAAWKWRKPAEFEKAANDKKFEPLF